MAASSLIDGCRFTPTLGGLTDWTYSTAVIGYNSPALAGVVNGAQYSYHAQSADLSQWEDGIGLYNTGTGVLTRATVLYNSSGTGTAAGQSGAGTKISFSAVPQVAIVALKEDLGFAGGVTAGFTNSLGADVALTSISTFFDGPVVTQGSVGLFWVSGTVTVIDSVGAAGVQAKLWDGTTVIASCEDDVASASIGVSLTLSGIISAPAGNLRISVKNNTHTTGTAISFNRTGLSKDSTITVIRIG